MKTIWIFFGIMMPNSLPGPSLLQPKSSQKHDFIQYLCGYFTHVLKCMNYLRAFTELTSVVAYRMGY
jgi:hypothetical protein